MKRNFPLYILDEYAKRLTSKLAKKLYEFKCNKKYKKPLYENLQYQSSDNFCVHLTKYILEKNNSSIKDILTSYINKFKLQYNVVNEGIYLYTPSEKCYTLLIETLINNGYNVNLLKSVQKKETRKLIENINMVKIRRKKLYEDDNPIGQAVQAAQQSMSNTLQTGQQLSLPANNQQNQAQGQQLQVDNNLQQQQLSSEQQQLLQNYNNNIKPKVEQILNNMTNTYWLMANNVPEEIQKILPDFKQGNQLADEAIKLWNTFKEKPEEASFNAFINSFKNFGNPQANQQQQQNENHKKVVNFKRSLNENLRKAKNHKKVMKAVNYSGLFA